MSLHGPEAGALAHIAEDVMREYEFVPYPPKDAMSQAADAPETPGHEDGVRDLRDLPWTSIDNPDSRDLDQIEAIEAVAEGTRLFVGIADVDALVPRGSPIDRFAGANTTSVYTGVRTFPMLPERLSFDVTSLLEGRPRLAVVFETSIGNDGRVGPVKIAQALVRNQAKLDYPSVSAWLDGKGPRRARWQPTRVSRSSSGGKTRSRGRCGRCASGPAPSTWTRRRRGPSSRTGL